MIKKYDSSNIFAKIIRGEIPADKVYEDDKILAFYDISKATPVHILVLPKGEYIDFADFVFKASNIEVANFFKKVSEIAKMLNLDDSGYRLISNKGIDGGQTIAHFHIHILGGKKMSNLLP